MSYFPDDWLSNPENLRKPEQNISEHCFPLFADSEESAQTREESIRRCVEVLLHASLCRDINCQRPKCNRLKQILDHVRGCKTRQERECSTCKSLIALCVYHAKKCTDQQCNVPFCEHIKAKLEQN